MPAISTLSATTNGCEGFNDRVVDRRGRPAEVQRNAVPVRPVIERRGGELDGFRSVLFASVARFTREPEPPTPFCGA